MSHSLPRSYPPILTGTRIGRLVALFLSRNPLGKLKPNTFLPKLYGDYFIEYKLNTAANFSACFNKMNRNIQDAIYSAETQCNRCPTTKLSVRSGSGSIPNSHLKQVYKKNIETIGSICMKYYKRVQKEAKMYSDLLIRKFKTRNVLKSLTPKLSTIDQNNIEY